MQSWLEGRIWVGKGAQATGMTASLRIQSSKADSNSWKSFTRSELKLESVASRVTIAQTSSGKELPSHFWIRDNVRSILPWLWRKRTGLLLSGPKSSFQMKVNFAFLLEIKVPESGGRVERHMYVRRWLRLSLFFCWVSLSFLGNPWLKGRSNTGGSTGHVASPRGRAVIERKIGWWFCH